MKAFKIKIPNTYISELVQKKAFELGYSWYDLSKAIRRINSPGLSFEQDGEIGYWDEIDDTFDEWDAEEITWHEFLLLESAEEEEMTVNDLLNKSGIQHSTAFRRWVEQTGYGNYKLVKP